MSRLDISNFFSSVAPRLESVEVELQKLSKSDIPVVSRLRDHVSRGQGKRLRPALVLLASKYCGCSSDEDILYGAIFELLHTATLIHDDVIDHASVRRGCPSLNATWGNTLSVLFGDFLFSRAIKGALERRNWRMMEIFVDVATRMIEGELIQNECLYKLDTSRQTYFDILEKKTAFLFAACAECGAVIAGKDQNTCRSLFNFGMELGRAFQLVDDLLDYTSTSEILGKPVFSDLREGKLTLPTILLLERVQEKTTPILKRIWASDIPGLSTEDAQTLQELLVQHKVVDDIRALAEQASKAATDSLPKDFGDPEIAKLLQEIPKMLMKRTY
jgi:octaprenyl-diphosphate synthase